MRPTILESTGPGSLRLAIRNRAARCIKRSTKWNNASVSCLPNLGEVGSNIVELTRSQDGVTFTPLPAQQIEPDGIVSAIKTDASGAVYISHTALVGANGNIINGSDANGNSNAVVVVRFPNGFNETTAIPLNGQTLCQAKPTLCTTEVVYSGALDSAGNSTITVGQILHRYIDRAGNLYVTWAQAPVSASTGQVSGSSQIYIAVSTNHGATWGPPAAGDRGDSNFADQSVFPGSWLAIPAVWTWSGMELQPSALAPISPVDQALSPRHWSVMMAQSLNTIVNGKPNSNPEALRPRQVSEVSNHYGSKFVLSESPAPQDGDRGLLDFISVTIGLKGEANVVWADAVNQRNGWEKNFRGCSLVLTGNMRVRPLCQCRPG